MITALYQALEEQRIDVLIVAQDARTGTRCAMMGGDRLAVALWEADRHAAALADALLDWDALPEPMATVQSGDKSAVRLADPLLFALAASATALPLR